MSFISRVACVVLAVVSVNAFAAKVAVFDHEAAILQTKVAQKRIKKLQEGAEYTQIIAKAESLRADLQVLSKEVETKSMTWSEAQRLEQNKKIEYARADLQLAAKKIQAEQAALAKGIMDEFRPKLDKALKKIIESSGIEVVLVKQAVYYAAESIDITAKVTKELNKQ